MTEFLQIAFSGIAQGASYALVALGFVIIYKATGVINFAQGALVLAGGYFAYQFLDKWGLPFPLAVLLAMISCAILGLLIEATVLRRMVGQPIFALIMITVGLTIALEQIVIIIWGGDRLPFSDPWGVETILFGDVIVPKTHIARIAVTAVLLLGFFLFFRFSSMGVAMRATASDQEAAMAQGISVRRIFGLSWAISAAIATLAGVMLMAGGRGAEPTLGLVALVAFPAIILGGLDSPGGAIVGGIVMGVVEQLTAGYASKLP